MTSTELEKENAELKDALSRANALIGSQANENDKIVNELSQQLAAFHAAMEREKKPDWEKWLKELADGIDTYTLNVEYYIATSPAWPKYREMFGHAARQLRYMADCFTLKANFVPSELRIKELEKQVESLTAKLDYETKFYDEADSELEKLKQQLAAAEKEHERLEAEAAVMRSHVKVLLSEIVNAGMNETSHDRSAKHSLNSTAAGAELLAKLERYEKAFRDWLFQHSADSGSNPCGCYSCRVARKALGEQ